MLTFMEEVMNSKLLIKIFLTIALFVMVVGCGGSKPEPAPAPTEVAVVQTPTKASTQIPTEVPPQALAVGFTPETVCRVPDLVGEDVSMAESTLAAAGLQPVKDFQHDESVATNAIISQEPAAKTMLEPCEGYVDIVISLGPPPVPTDTPPPTETPGPTETPAPPTETPTPTTVPPTVTPTPDPRLFFDDFEAGVKPEWGMSGNFATVNGQLVIDRSLEGFVGDESWTNYAVTLNNVSFKQHGWELRLRIQDQNNYMVLKFWGTNPPSWEWSRVINGEQQKIPGANYNFDRRLKRNSLIKVEAEGSAYRIFINDQEVIYFTDNTFDRGGIGLIVTGAPINMGSVEVKRLP